MKGGDEVEEKALDFSVVMETKVDKDTIVITSEELTKERLAQIVNSAIAGYDPANAQYSRVLSYTDTGSTLTQSLITSIGSGTQTDLTKVLQANAIIRQYMNYNDIIGMVAHVMQSSINTEYRLSYANFAGQKKKSNQLEKAKGLIDDFNNQIDIKAFIRSAISTAYFEGNYVCAVRNNQTNWVLDQYPLGIAEVAQYTEASRPIVQINMQSLKNALSTTILKNKKGKALYFEDTLNEIKGAFGPEILKAYQGRDDYCRLPSANTGVVRVNNFGKLYGLSPIFRTLSDLLILESLRDADIAMAKTKAKTIIHQIMRGECLSDGKYNDYSMLAWNHQNLMAAFKQNTVVYTSMPQIEKVEYVTPQAQEVSVEKQDAYIRRILASLGISFLVPDENQTTTTAKISWQVLMQQINAISEQVERVLENFYRTVLIANGIELIYAPSIHIIDSEMMDSKTKIELAKMLYSTLACSRATVFGTLGIDLEDEAARRQEENDDGLDEVFYAFPTSYTTPGTPESSPGRPQDGDTVDEDKQQEDQQREDKGKNRVK